MAEARPWESPYSYCANNPLRYIDPTGMEYTNFEDANGNLVKHVEDGSNAVFRQTGAGVNKHYAFNRFDESQKGTNQETFAKLSLQFTENKLFAAVCF